MPKTADAELAKRIADELRALVPSEEDQRRGVVLDINATTPNPVTVGELRRATAAVRARVQDEGTAGLSGNEQVVWQQEVASREAARRFRRNLPRLLVAAVRRERGTLTAPRTAPRARNSRQATRRRARPARSSSSGDADSESDLDLPRGAVAA